jgi:hypothetical protein
MDRRNFPLEKSAFTEALVAVMLRNDWFKRSFCGACAKVYSYSFATVLKAIDSGKIDFLYRSFGFLTIPELKAFECRYSAILQREQTIELCKNRLMMPFKETFEMWAPYTFARKRLLIDTFGFTSTKTYGWTGSSLSISTKYKPN